MQARMDALISQINPHFLFNTLNTVSSLIRFDPDTARTVLLKLANILRRRLKSQMHFVPLNQELEFIDDYLDIEVVRFGRDKLHICKEIEPETLGLMVPSMILQPLARERHPAWNRSQDRGRHYHASRGAPPAAPGDRGRGRRRGNRRAEAAGHPRFRHRDEQRS